MPRTRVSEKAVRGIVAGDGLVAHAPERRGYGSCGGETTPAPGSLADRGFTAGRPNGKWLAGITGIRAGDGKGVPLAAGRLPRRQDRRACRRVRSRRGAGQPDVGGSGCHAARGRASPGAFRPRPPLPVAGVARAHGTVWADALHGREGPQPGQRGRGGLLRMHEDGIRPSRALGGAYPRPRCSPRSTTASAGTTLGLQTTQKALTLLLSD